MEELIKERRAEGEQVAWSLVCTMDSVAAVRCIEVEEEERKKGRC